MKKAIVVLTTLALTNTIMLVGCKKADDTISPAPRTVNLEKIDTDLRAINAKYAHVAVANKSTQSARSANTWAIAGADGVAAVGAISQTWTWCSTLLGGLAAGIVTVASSAVGSYAMYKTCGGWLVVNPGTGGDGNNYNGNTDVRTEKERIVSQNGNYSIPNPYRNPYDANGAQHNYWVKVLCSKEADQSMNPLTLMFNDNDFSQDQMSYLSYDQDHIGYGIADFVNKDNVFDNSGMVTHANMISHYLASDANLRNITSEFMQGFSQVQDNDQAMKFLNDYENYFMNNSTGLSDMEIASLLNGFSVSKYSYAMWYDAFSNN